MSLHRSGVDLNAQSNKTPDKRVRVKRRIVLLYYNILFSTDDYSGIIRF